MSTIIYPDALLFPALMREVREAQSSIQIMTFLFRTGYAQPTRADELLNAVIEAQQQRGVEVFAVMNNSRFEPDVAADNYATAQKLADAGCTVRMGPRNQTLHTKLAIFDLQRVFVGSHNLTRGALSFNREVTVYTEVRETVRRLRQYYNQVWAWSTRFSETPPPDPSATPVAIRLLSAMMAGQEVELAFSVNHTVGVDAFAAVSDDALDLEGANMGETVAPDLRLARVTPTVEAGQTVCLAVRAYSQGTVEAESNIVSMTYQPTEPGEGGGEPGGGGEPPAPEPLTAPTVTSVTQASPTTVTVAWTFIGAGNFHRFVIQQRSLEQVWQQIGIVMEAAAREWTGSPNSMDSVNPFRVVVYNTADESATSNEVLLTPPPLTAPVLTSVAQVGAEGIRVDWTYLTDPSDPTDFHRLEVQQRTNGTWQVVGTTQDPSARTWSGGPTPFMDAVHPVRVVVFDMQERSAASNEMPIAGMMPAVPAPVLTVVETVTLEQIHVEWTYETPENFHRFEIQQRVAEATWQPIATVTDPTARSWNGPAPIMDDVHPIRVVVFNTAEQSAASNELPIVLTVFAPPVPPVIVSITPYEAGVRVVWTWEDSGRFSHFVVQQRDEAQVWHNLATVRGPSDREWIGQPLDMSTTHPYRVWVYNVTGESAVSEEGFLAMG